jgi:hypothetical protein
MHFDVSTDKGSKEINILLVGQLSKPIMSPFEHSTNIPISENPIVAPTVPAPIMATLEAVGVGIVALLVYGAICRWN